MPRRNLVLARVGRRSLHPRWLDAARDRNWDLVLVPFEPLDPQDHLDCTVLDVVPGPKWTGLREALHRWDGWRGYELVWLPDDDLLTSQTTVDQMFAMARGAGLELFAPALHEGSYFAHFDTVRNPRFAGRRTGFVEIMAPGFATPALERLLPTLSLTRTGWGWGLDSVWPKLLGYRDVGVLDATPVLHTRPVGALRDPALARAVREESDRMLAQHDCEQVHATFAAFGPDLRPLERTPDALLLDLVEGWQPLIRRDPRILGWIAAAQQAHFGRPAYPAAGTPAEGIRWPSGELRFVRAAGSATAAG